MQEHIRCIKKGEIHDHYLGHNIQNEFMQMLAIQIKKYNYQQYEEGKYFSIIIDCAPNTSHQEQMSIVFLS